MSSIEIRVATLADKAEIVDLYIRSQKATKLPDPSRIPPRELGPRLYARKAIERYVAVEGGKIVGHGLFEVPTPLHLPLWQKAVAPDKRPLIEMGAAFVDPNLAKRGIWTALLRHRLTVIRSRRAIPVAGTWSQNKHVKKTFRKHGGTEIGQQQTDAGEVSLFVFKVS